MIPKWNCRVLLAHFVGFSPKHSTLVANVRHLQTNHVRPQFHLIHDDNFETILNDTPLDHPLSDKCLLDIFETSCEVYSDIERSEDGAIVYTLPPLLNEGKWCEKRLEIAKERACARNHWKFEDEQAPIPIPTLQPTRAPTSRPPSGPVVLDDESSCSSESSDDDTIASVPMHNLVPDEVGCYRQCTRPTEGAAFGGQCQSTRLRQGRNPHPVYPLTGLALGLSHLAKKPHTHVLVTQFSCTLGAKQPSPLGIPNHINLSKRKLESLYLAKVTFQDHLLFANLD